MVLAGDTYQFTACFLGMISAKLLTPSTHSQSQWLCKLKLREIPRNVSCHARRLLPYSWQILYWPIMNAFTFGPIWGALAQHWARTGRWLLYVGRRFRLNTDCFCTCIVMVDKMVIAWRFWPGNSRSGWPRSKALPSRPITFLRSVSVFCELWAVFFLCAFASQECCIFRPNVEPILDQ